MSNPNSDHPTSVNISMTARFQWDALQAFFEEVVPAFA